MTDALMEDVSRHIWETKYRYRDAAAAELSIEDTWHRIARAVSAAESHDRAGWERRFFDILRDFKFLPGGRIQAGAGTGLNVTLFNCFVMGPIEDSMEGIFRALREGALTMQQGGGVGYDFSTLRPRGTPARGVGAIASGPVSFMGVWDAMCETILSTGARRGAMIGTLRCDHPDIEEFISAKKTPGVLRHFNLSVQITGPFMTAVRADGEWPLTFPGTGSKRRIYGHVRARSLWEKLLRANYEYAEPGVLFVDRINQVNNLWYREHITATNPCGEIPLPPYGACDLGSLNLTRFVRDPFTPHAKLDEADLTATSRVATRFLDNVIDVSKFPLPEQEASARSTRRIGLGVTGLADALIMLGLNYASDEARRFASNAMRLVCHTAYRTSVELAKEKGTFSALDRRMHLVGTFISALPEEIRAGIEESGIRNSHLLAIAPAGTISLLAGNISGGLEPVFAGEFQRRILPKDGSATSFHLVDYALASWRQLHPGSQEPPAFLRSSEIVPHDHIAMQAALQPYVDNSISKTVIVPRDYSFQSFARIYECAYDSGLKGCTTFRPNPTTGSVITSLQDAAAEASHCCAIDREPD